MSLFEWLTSLGFFVVFLSLTWLGALVERIEQRLADQDRARRVDASKRAALAAGEPWRCTCGARP